VNERRGVERLNYREGKRKSEGKCEEVSIYRWTVE
jgi:hypothetical protein